MANSGTEVEASARPNAISPKDRYIMGQDPKPSAPESAASILEARTDPDAQMTVNDFLDFTEYLPSDMTRSLTLIRKLDQTYTDASIRVNDLTVIWGQLPSISVDERPDPVKLRAEISRSLDQAVSSRVFAHAEAVRMSENVNRHYIKAKVLLGKLQTMIDNYPTEAPKSPVATKSPQMSRARLTVRPTDEDGKMTRNRVPKITVPGEVLAPYEIEYDSCTDDSDISSDSWSDMSAAARRTPAPNTRIKIVPNKTPKSAASRKHNSAAMSAAAAANAAALLNPPPENAVIGSKDAPWLQLTQYELAKLRKRMKKSATWIPSETMVARELKVLGRGPEEYHEAKRQAEEEGKAFNPTVPSLVVDKTSGARQLPASALNVDSLTAESHPISNRGMKLNEDKKLKREALAKLAAEEAEESARKMAQAAKLFLGNAPAKVAEKTKENGTGSGKGRTSSRSNSKRKREAEDENTEQTEATETPSRPLPKRTKTETHVPPPHHGGLGVGSGPAADGAGSSALLAASWTVVVTQQLLETPVPIPVPPQTSSARSSGASPTSTVSAGNTMTMSVPTKPPASETPVPLPRTDQKRALVQLPPLVMRDSSKRETRGDAAKRNQQQPAASAEQDQQVVSEQATSHGQTPVVTPGSESAGGRRPGSRGAAMSQEPGPSLAADRPRRASTARNTPVPDVKQTPKRAKRPAPGVVSTTSSGGNSAVGKRKAAPRRKARTARKDKGPAAEMEMEEVDDEGNTIDPEEPRYCICNRVSFGTMIQCDNVDVSRPARRRQARNQGPQLTGSEQNCKQEWFHLECVDLSDIPARTTRWYCPDCRRVLNIGERGEVSARGVRK